MASTPDPKPPTPRKPKRPAHLPHGRWLGDLEPLSAAEKSLVAACAKGEFWWPEGWDYKTRHYAATPANTIRADLIRFLLLGGDANHPVHENGLMAGGAWISGTLDVYQVSCPVRLALRHCHLENTPILIAATLPELGLIGCALPGLDADRLKVKGSVYLREGFTASGEVRLLSAEIGGNLDCSGGSFANAGGYALRADELKVKGSLFLRDAKIEGAINLAAARIDTLIDDAQCWQAGGHSLDGLRYDRIIGPTDAASRIAWLQKQHPPSSDI